MTGIVIGITGLQGAGKDEAARFFARKGFYEYSLADELRAILREQQKVVDRDALLALGNELRAAHGTGYLAALVRLKLKRPAVVNSIRNPGEVEELRKAGDFFLVNVTAPVEARYQRVVARRREGEESLTFDEFRAKEARELAGPETGQQLLNVASMADAVVANDSTLEALREKLEDLYRMLQSRYTKETQ
jgi:dephospho-CoA kinase